MSAICDGARTIYKYIFMTLTTVRKSLTVKSETFYPDPHSKESVMSEKVNTLSDIPKEKHWMILRFSTVTIPEDARSHENPGHGYPESTEHVAHYTAYTDTKEMEKEVAKLKSSGLSSDDFYVAEVHPATVITKTSVLVKS